MNHRQSKLLFCLVAAVGLMASIPALAGAALTFKPVVGLDVGENPSSLARADLDGDGKADLVVANFGSNSVSVLAGRGDGSFGPGRDFPAGTSPRAIEIGDFDGDGSPDVVTANANSNDVSLLLNSGTGTLGAAIALPAGVAPFGIAKGDLNGDGRPDLVVANFQASNVSVLINTGNANFAAQQTFGVGSGPFSVRVADLNNDGRPDIATADASADTVSVRLNTTDSTGSPVTFGSTTAFPTGDGPFAITGSDFNSDGRPDLATANSGAGTVSVLLGQGSGSFGAPVSSPVGDGPYDLATGDFDGDRVVDIVAANFDSDDVTVLSGEGDGSFADGVNFGVGNGPFGVIAADLNDDRAADIATADLNAGKASVLVNSPTAILSGTSLRFGGKAPVPKGTVSAPLGSTLTNGGSAPLLIDAMIPGGRAANDYIFEGGACPPSLQPGQSCRIRVRFAPTAEGSRSASIEIRTNAASNPLLALSGRAGPFPRAKVACKLTRPKSRKPGVTCTVTYPVSTVLSKTRWALSRSGVTVRRGSVRASKSPAVLRIGNLNSLPGGRYVLEVGGRNAASFVLPR